VVETWLRQQTKYAVQVPSLQDVMTMDILDRTTDVRMSAAA